MFGYQGYQNSDIGVKIGFASRMGGGQYKITGFSLTKTLTELEFNAL